MEIKVGEFFRDKRGLILKYEYLKEYDNFEVDFGQKGKCITFDDMEEFEDYLTKRYGDEIYIQEHTEYRIHLK